MSPRASRGARKLWALAILALVVSCAPTTSVTPSPSRGASILAFSTTTTATGTLVDDPTGEPLSNVAVRLYAWKPCVKISRTQRTCPAPLRTTTTHVDGTFALPVVPNGHYLLVIGDDDPGDVTHPTIHDQIWLKGGRQQLVAPTLPAQPVGAPFVMFVPSVERHGQYRILTMNKWERLCTQAFNAERTQRNLPPFVTDEWLIENTRTMNAYRATITPRTKTIYGVQFLVNGTADIGSDSCRNGLAVGTFQQPKIYPQAIDPRTIWFGGIWYYARYKGYPPGDGEGNGFAEFPRDPRLYPNGQQFPRRYPPWP